MQFCYATGNISGPVNVGGITGQSNVEHDGSSSISYCVALNPRITRSEGANTGFARVAGLNNGVTLSNNYARSSMLVLSATVSDSSENGAGITAANWDVQSWWTGNSWGTGVWNFSGLTIASIYPGS
jgi:hypothetical protein